MNKKSKIFLPLIILVTIATVLGVSYLGFQAASVNSGQQSSSSRSRSQDDEPVAAAVCLPFVDTFDGTSFNPSYWRPSVNWKIDGGNARITLNNLSSQYWNGLMALNSTQTDASFEATFNKPTVTGHTSQNAAYAALQVRQPAVTGTALHMGTIGLRYTAAKVSVFAHEGIYRGATHDTFRKDITTTAYSTISFKIVRKGGNIELYYRLDNNAYGLPVARFTNFAAPVVMTLVGEVYKGSATSTPTLDLVATRASTTCLPTTPVANYCGDAKCRTNETCEFTSNGSRACRAEDISTATGPSGREVSCNGKCNYCGDGVPMHSNGVEQCDQGSNNGKAGYACRANCTFDPAYASYPKNYVCTDFATDDLRYPKRWAAFGFNYIYPNVSIKEGLARMTFAKLDTAETLNGAMGLFRTIPVSGNFVATVKHTYSNKQFNVGTMARLRIHKSAVEETEVTRWMGTDGKEYIGANIKSLTTYAVTNIANRQVDLGESVYFRVKKVGNTYTYMYSVDGLNYSTLGTYTTTKIDKALVGLVTDIPNTKVAVDSRWTEFKVSCN